MYTWHSYLKLLQYTLHLLMYVVIRCWQSIYWRISGIHQHLEATKDGNNYESSAQLLHIWCRSRLLNIIVFQRRHFITSHVRFVHPEFALQKHVALLSVSRKHAIFSVPNRDVNVYDTRKWPFLFDALFEAADHLLLMPIASLHKLAETLPDTKAKVLWIYHTGRCGSTALAQAFNALPDAVALSEPTSCLSQFQEFCGKQQFLNYDRNCKEYRDLFNSVVRLTIKPSFKRADIIVVKANPMNAFADVGLLTEIFPTFKIIFMYRDVEPQVSSLYRAIAGYSLMHDITIWVARSAFLSKLFPTVEPLPLKYNCCYSTKEHVLWVFRKENVKKFGLFMGFTIGWAENCYHYQEVVKRQKLFIPAFKFEHMKSNFQKYLLKIFQHIGLDVPEERLELMNDALSRDSQDQSFVSKEKISKTDVLITPDMIKEANGCLRFYDLPEWGESLTLPNTVT